MTEYTPGGLYRDPDGWLRPKIQQQPSPSTTGQSGPNGAGVVQPNNQIIPPGTAMATNGPVVQPLPYLIETLAIHEPLIVASPPQTLTTGILADFAVSLAFGVGALRSHADRGFSTAGPLCVRFVTEAAVVGAVNHRIAVIAASKGITWPLTQPTLDVRGADVWSLKADEFVAELVSESVQVVVFDFMLSIPARATIMNKWHDIFHLVATCACSGIVPILRLPLDEDHALMPSREDIKFPVPEALARQFLFVTRRTDYEIGTGVHRLLMVSDCPLNAGAFYLLNVCEGSDRSQWSLTYDFATQSLSAAAQGNPESNGKGAAQPSNSSTAGPTAGWPSAKQKLWNALGKYPDGETETVLRKEAGVSPAAAKRFLAELEHEGLVVKCEIKKPAGRYKERAYPAFKRAA
ncbi:MAG: hypothetical protein DWQ34_25770 [Planctomycetota bacterium]|nr:MAG: hypothetical protein DWQ34_25770 [Planctomycetota bacterium]REK29740.1 MAG: hypothetical protein DWQ41_03635 [Planctomycetota bacterium]REK30438.1 MAG: hypothetical protein DWQ45_21400 [Planctomycetota bacterium]